MDMLFLRPSTQEEALALLTQYKQDAMIVAGGTDAVLRLTQKKTAPAVILSLDAIPERHEIAASDDTVRLASGVTYNELLASDVLRLYRGLREAVLHLASPAIRAVATPVGKEGMNKGWVMSGRTASEIPLPSLPITMTPRDLSAMAPCSYIFRPLSNVP